MAVSGKVVVKLEPLLKERAFPKLRLSKQSGVDYRTVLRYCKGDVQNIKLSVLEQFCQVLDCKVGDIIEFEKEK